jgi:hypothetical protein
MSSTNYCNLYNSYNNRPNVQYIHLFSLCPTCFGLVLNPSSTGTCTTQQLLSAAYGVCLQAKIELNCTAAGDSNQLPICTRASWSWAQYKPETCKAEIK